MKNIAFLTDFSARSEHAALYALHFAKKINASVLLYNMCPAQPVMQLAAASDYPENIEQDANTENNNSLNAFGIRIKTLLSERSFPGTLLPEINYCGGSGDIVDVMTSVLNNNDTTLIVTAPPCDEDISTFMMSEDFRKIVDWAAAPVLVVPENATIRNPEKVAFTTNLNSNDIPYINALGGLVQRFAPEIMIAHLNNDNAIENGHAEAEENFLSNISNHVDYGRIYYRSIPASSNKKGWQWLKANKKCDLLVMVQQSRALMEEFFKREQTLDITYHLPVPVLIFPAP